MPAKITARAKGKFVGVSSGDRDGLPGAAAQGALKGTTVKMSAGADRGAFGTPVIHVVGEIPVKHQLRSGRDARIQGQLHLVDAHFSAGAGDSHGEEGCRRWSGEADLLPSPNMEVVELNFQVGTGRVGTDRKRAVTFKQDLAPELEQIGCFGTGVNDLGSLTGEYAAILA